MSICLSGDGKACQYQPDDQTQSDSSRYCRNEIVARTQRWYEEHRIPKQILALCQYCAHPMYECECK
jgi:hypothetical protein